MTATTNLEAALRRCQSSFAATDRAERVRSVAALTKAVRAADPADELTRLAREYSGSAAVTVCDEGNQESWDRMAAALANLMALGEVREEVDELAAGQVWHDVTIDRWKRGQAWKTRNLPSPEANPPALE